MGPWLAPRRSTARSMVRSVLSRTRSVLLLAMTLLSSSCTDPPAQPTEPDDRASSYAALVAWFAQRGIVLPAEQFAPEPAPKAAQDDEEEILLGDVTRNGRVTSWDLTVLWHYLTRYDFMASYYDMDILDIDRDGDTDWVDLRHLGEYLYVAGVREHNPYRIGERIDYAKERFQIELIFKEGHGFTEEEIELFRRDTARWEKMVTSDLPDFDLSGDPLVLDGVRLDGVVDDIVVIVESVPYRQIKAWGAAGTPSTDRMTSRWWERY